MLVRAVTATLSEGLPVTSTGCSSSGSADRALALCQFNGMDSQWRMKEARSKDHAGPPVFAICAAVAHNHLVSYLRRAGLDEEDDTTCSICASAQLCTVARIELNCTRIQLNGARSGASCEMEMLCPISGDADAFV